MKIPEGKRYFRIGEVSRIIGVEPYVLRYWEGEFPQIRPNRADTNQRIYQKKDLETIMEIKRLLYEEKLTIEGARKRLKQTSLEKKIEDRALIDELKADLNEILRLLT
ncbi:MAG: MerR family transcriptional regulator [Desulfatiglandales bacterium]|jgi:DNA-binding transcriptional MerR regulator